jgi:hypothetical protein
VVAWFAFAMATVPFGTAMPTACRVAIELVGLVARGWYGHRHARIDRAKSSRS